MGKETLLYISMPDTYFVNFAEGRGLHWDWYVQEHHILWNMLDFIDFAEENGLKCVYQQRNFDLHKQVDEKWYWKKDFKTIFKVAND